MLEWVDEEEEIAQKAVINYKMPSIGQKKSAFKVMNFQQMRDYIHVFVNIDHDLDGFITMDNFKRYFSTVMSSKSIHDLFWNPIT